MDFKKLKYLLSLTVPVTVFLSLYLPGYWSFLTVVYAFGMIPLAELVLAPEEENMSAAEESVAASSRYYDFIVYLNVPLQVGFMVYFVYLLGFTPLTWVELAGKVASFGLSCGALGINVAHELGHRKDKLEQFMSKILLMTSLYMHFFIEHNRGHHKRVSTDEDPASSRLGQSIYNFIPRSVVGGYFSAWKLERQRLETRGFAFWSVHNEMIRFTAIQTALLVAIFAFFGLKALTGFVLAAIVGFSMLETVNYIEHYGLRREKKANGKYERVMPAHSWNSNHPYGRLVLYELTRHSDHHYLASRPYQVLRHFEEAPQMPTGYPGMMLLALIPPIWFSVMDKRVMEVQEQSASFATA